MSIFFVAVSGLVSLAVAVLGATAADAGLTTDKCLVKKRQAWITLRKCQAAADVKRLKGKPADLVKCQTQFEEKRAKINAQAAKAAVACRYGDNGDQTVTDYDTGLMWEKKDGVVGGMCPTPAAGVSHCVNTLYSWFKAFEYVAGASANGTAIEPFLAGHTDWRMPTIVELGGIFDENAAGCGTGPPCIDPIFGPTVGNAYWTSTASAADSAFAFTVVFQSGTLDGGNTKQLTYHVRAVRAAL